MTMFSVFGRTMATYCGQNLGAGRIDRVKKKASGSAFSTPASGVRFPRWRATIGRWLVYLVTGSTNEVVILNATNYLKFDTLFYYVTAVICVLRNAMQGLGDHITPLISSSLEMVGKIVIAATLVPMLGYTGVYCGGAAGVVYHGDSTRRCRSSGCRYFGKKTEGIKGNDVSLDDNNA